MVIKGVEVKPGMFCMYGGCTIWFEILYVGNDWLKVVSRRPSEQTDLVTSYHIDSSLFEISETTPDGHWIAGTRLTRRKNFYDKFYPELTRIIPSKQRLVYAQHRDRVKQGTHSPVSRF